jgi:hypothetical protein
MKQQLSRKRSGLLRKKALFCFAANHENRKRKKHISKNGKNFLKSLSIFHFF